MQIACPRLSVDWGHYFDKPLLSTYELEIALDRAVFQEVYPMDYYRKDGELASSTLLFPWCFSFVPILKIKICKKCCGLQIVNTVSNMFLGGSWSNNCSDRGDPAASVSGECGCKNE